MKQLITKFECVTPKHSNQEFEMLTESILERGVLDPIKVWRNVIIDGHARYHICQKYGIPFETMEMSFNSNSEAIVWIIKSQLGRRNLTPFQRCEMVLEFEAEIKAETEKRRREAIRYYQNTGSTMGEGVKTYQLLANMAGVSCTTIKRARKILQIGDEETKRRVRAGEISIRYAYYELINRPSDTLRDTSCTPHSSSLAFGSFIKVNNLDAIHDAVKRLIRLVEDGEAGPKVLLEELKAVSAMIEMER